jgi:hypothetical protein
MQIAKFGMQSDREKLSDRLLEFAETRYWLKLCAKSFPNLAEHLRLDVNEAEELIRSFSKSVITAKTRVR